MTYYKSSHRGFTLIEVIVAIGIFSVLSFACYEVVRGIISINDKVDNKAIDLEGMTRLIRTLDQDFRQIVPRKIKNENDEIAPSITTEKKYLPDNAVIEFSRKGARNPLLERRSEMIRVGYSIESDIDEIIQNEDSGMPSSNSNSADIKKSKYLVRYVWSILDRPKKIDPVKYVLLGNVDSLLIEFMSDKGDWYEEWPPMSSNDNQDSEIPCAIKLNLVLADGKKIERLYSIRDIPMSEKQ